MPALIIGCGRVKWICNNPLHADNTGDKAIIWEKKHDHKDSDVTMDIQSIMHPDIVGDITSAGKTGLDEQTYREYFNIAIFERVPASIFETTNQCANAFGRVFRVLKLGSQLVIRSGSNLDLTKADMLKKMITKKGFTCINVISPTFLTANK